MAKGYPIPENINPASDRCVRVWIPNSPGYSRALSGSLALLGKWYAWEREETHSGKDAAARYRQAYTKTIRDMLSGLSCDCSEQPPANGNDELGSGIGGANLWDLEGAIMAGVLDVKIENGILYKRMHPCCEWFEVGAIALAEEEIDTDVIPPPEVPPADLACRKAYHMATMLNNVAQTGVEVYLPTGALYWGNDMKSAYPALEMSTWRLWQAFAALSAGMVLEFAISWSSAFSIRNLEELICRWEPLLDPGTNSITTAEFNGMVHEVRQVTALYTEEYLEALMNAIGKSGFSWVAAGAVNETEAYCGCPASVNDPRENFPDYMDWLYWWDLTKEVPASFELAGESEHLPGIGVVDNPAATGTSKPGLNIISRAWHADTDIELLYLEWSTEIGSDYTGNKVRLYSPSTVFFTGTNPDVDPSASGRFQKTLLMDYSPVVAADKVQWDVELNTGQGDEQAYRPVIISVGIAGTGPDPIL